MADALAYAQTQVRRFWPESRLGLHRGRVIALLALLDAGIITAGGFIPELAVGVGAAGLAALITMLAPEVAMAGLIWAQMPLATLVPVLYLAGLGVLPLVLLGRPQAAGRVLAWPMLALAAYGALILVSLTWTPSPNYGGMKAGEVWAGAIPLTMVIAMLADDARTLGRWARASAWMGAAFVAYCGAMYVVGGGTDLGGRWTVNHWFVIELSRRLGIAAIAAAWFALYGRARGRAFWALIVVAALGLCLATGSRGPLLGTVAGLGVLVLLAPGIGLRWKATLASIGIAGLGMAVAFSGGGKAGGGGTGAGASRILGGAAGKGSGAEQDASTLTRAAFAIIVVGSLPVNPMLGYGAGAFSHVYQGIDHPLYPHNVFLEAVYEQGWVGLALLLAILLMVAWRVWRTRRRWLADAPLCAEVAWALALLVGTLTATQFSEDFRSNWIPFAFGVYLWVRLDGSGLVDRVQSRT